MSQPTSIGDLNQWSQLLNKLEKGTYLYQDKNQHFLIASFSSEKKLKGEEILNTTLDFVIKANEMGEIKTSLDKFKNRMTAHYYQGLCGLVYRIMGLFLSRFQFNNTTQGLKFSNLENEIARRIKLEKLDDKNL